MADFDRQTAVLQTDIKSFNERKKIPVNYNYLIVLYQDCLRYVNMASIGS